MTTIRAILGRSWFGLGVVLLLLAVLSLLTVITTRWSAPASLDVSITVEACSLARYDDHAGHLPLAAVVQITNLSNQSAWFLGGPGTPTYSVQQLVAGKWETQTSVTWGQAEGPATRRTALRTMESVTIVAGPISEKAAEVRVAVPFITALPSYLPFITEHSPREAHWVYSAPVKIEKRGQDYFPETKPGSQQMEEVLPLR
jgi:hypothetical protein